MWGMPSELGVGLPAHGSACLRLPRTELSSVNNCAGLFYIGSEDLTQVMWLAKQVRYRPNRLPQLRFA